MSSFQVSVPEKFGSSTLRSSYNSLVSVTVSSTAAVVDELSLDRVYWKLPQYFWTFLSEEIESKYRGYVN